MTASEKVRFNTVYCPDRECYLYPPLTQAKTDDLTMGPYIMAMLENTDVSAYALGRALGRSGSVQGVYENQKNRWDDFA
jgi:predicted CDP-diglyceride synthetase/phosphatidate cytidylyltransferase